MSSTSSSWRIDFDPHLPHSVGSTRATVTWSQSLQNQAGMRCPHQSWREMVQSLMLVIQCMYVLVHSSGTKRVLPVSTARMAGSASGCILSHH